MKLPHHSVLKFYAAVFSLCIFTGSCTGWHLHRVRGWHQGSSHCPSQEQDSQEHWGSPNPVHRVLPWESGWAKAGSGCGPMGRPGSAQAMSGQGRAGENQRLSMLCPRWGRGWWPWGWRGVLGYVGGPREAEQGQSGLVVAWGPWYIYLIVASHSPC